MKKSTLEVCIAFYAGFKVKEFLDKRNDITKALTNKIVEGVKTKIKETVTSVVLGKKEVNTNSNFIFETKADAMKFVTRLPEESEIIKTDDGWKVIFPQ